MNTTIIIPARMASTRLPRKPLADILGKSMIQRVYERCKLSGYANEVIIATDHHEIFAHAQSFGAKVFMTSDTHQSGTDRIGEVAKQVTTDLIVNVQGDEPLINPAQIDELIEKFHDESIQIATQKMRLDNNDFLYDYNIVKVVTDLNGKALYFSRQAIPAFRDIPYRNWMDKHTYYRHVGMYAYRTSILQQLISLPQSDLEKVEALEQLRWLSNGFTIHCFETTYSSLSVDTQEDLDSVVQYLITEMNRQN